MEKNECKKRAINAIDKNRDRILALFDSVASEPELGFKEFKTAKKIKAFFDEMNFNYEDGVAITGVISTQKGRSSKLKVAVMGELDAVISSLHPKADKQTGAVHACGHNAQLAALAGVAAAIHDANLMDELDGDVALMAVPSEECIEIEYRNRLRKEGKLKFLGGKQEFIRLGKFDDVDIAIMQHTAMSDGGFKAGAGSPCNGFVSKIIHYTGKSAHAGSEPYNGINALNAASIGTLAVHAQRETFRDEDHIRVHSIMTKGGDVVNIVPADVTLEAYVRGANTPAILDASSKVNRAYKAGGDAVGAKTDITTLPGYMPVVMCDPLLDIMYKNMKELLGTQGVERLCAGFGGGSTDAGDVSQILPVVHSFFGGAEGGFHSERFQIVDRDLAVISAAKCLTMVLIDLLWDGAKEGLKIKNTYVPPMTKDEYLEKWGGIK
ncbi:MAG: amidohydrolase [Clostridia bacterium]|jgi:amidohydrolase|nr:amidohydrolase [Clostridia bacterium]